MSTFQEHCKSAARDYLQTVLIIDDQAKLGGIDTAASPVVMQPPKPSSALSGSPALGKIPSNTLVKSPVPSHNSFDATKATKAFFEHGLVAGIYRPEIEDNSDPDEFARSAVQVASRSDVIIVDWMLKDKIPSYSKSLIKAIIDHDMKSGGGLRCIIVYTGESDIAQLCDELSKFLKDSDNDDYELHNPDHYTLMSGNLIISFYNKEDSGPTELGRQKKEEELPTVALTEFSGLVKGIIPAFAMKSAAKIRDNTGRIIAKFDSELDAGFLAHRSLLPNAEDSEVFMLENFVSYMRNILSISKVDSESLGIDVLSKWVDANFDNLFTKVKINENDNGVDVTFEKEAIKKILKHGYNERKDGLYEELKNVTTSSRAKRIVKDVDNIINLTKIFSSSKSDVFDSSQELCILTTFRRTFRDIGNESELPYLTQGTLLYSLREEKYFLCVTPKCDTARVKTDRYFSFSELSSPNPKFDLIVPSHENKPIKLLSNSKFHELKHRKFSSNGNSKVVAMRDVNSGLICFDDDKGNKYQWIGDIEDMDIQKRVSDVVGNLNRIGTDEVEWLRRQG